MNESSIVRRARAILAQATQQPKSEPIASLPVGDDLVVEPAAENPRPVYWELADLSIVGPGRPEFLAKVGTGATERFWVIVEYQRQAIWVQANQLRSRKAFELQPEVREVVPISKDGF